MSNADVQKFREVLGQARRIILVAHKKPDGDAIGSALAMHNMLRSQGKETIPICIDSIPQEFSFLPGAEEFKQKLEGSFDLVIGVDCASLDMVAFEDLNIIVNIDHHPTNNSYGSINIIEPELSSTAEVLYNLFIKLGWVIDKTVATSLLTGIFTDTGSFQYPSTSPRTLEIAADLMKKGAYLPKIVQYTYQTKSLPTLRAWGKALSKVEINKFLEMAVSAISFEDLKKINAKLEDLSGVVSIINTVPDIRVALLLTQIDETHVKGSLRSTQNAGVDVAKMAEQFGGGGHKLAAGFTVKGKLVKTENGWEIK